MPDRASGGPRSVLGRLALFALIAGAMAGPPSVSAAGPTVEVDPPGPLPEGAQTITVTGSGFEARANGGVGIYVVFGPRTSAPTYYTDASLYGAARWVHPGAGDSAGQARLEDDGTFSTTLEIDPRYVDGHETPIDCLAVECVVITMAAHGVPDRRFDTFTPVPFTTVAAATQPATQQPTILPTTDEPPVPLAAAAAGFGIGVTALAVLLLAKRRRAA